MQRKAWPITTLFFHSFHFFSFFFLSQLCFNLLRTLQHPLDFGRPHHVSLNLELPAHKQSLRIRLAIHQLLEVRVGQHQLNIALLIGALRDGSLVLEVDGPAPFLARVVLEREDKDAVGALDGVLFCLWRLELGAEEVEDCRGRVGSWRCFLLVQDQ